MKPLRTTPPRVIVLATGGTIAGVQDMNAAYTAGQLSANALLSALPDLSEFASVCVEQIANIGSQSMTSKVWLDLMNRIRKIDANQEADAVVITHGTDTLEETAYFLHLALGTDLPVVLTGAMRPANAYGADGPQNLVDAIMWAVSPEAGATGVTVVMNGKVHNARYVQKQVCEGLDAFDSREAGPIARLKGCQITHYTRSIGQKHGEASQLTLEKALNTTDEKTLPRVSIYYAAALADDKMLEAVLMTKPQGIIVAGVGNGNVAGSTLSVLQEASRQGISVVRSSRCSSGYVTRNLEVADDAFGFIVAHDLNPQKARILLMLALQKTNDPSRIQIFFNEH